MEYLKNQRTLDRFGSRLQAFRMGADLSQEQLHLATGVGQSHIAKTELGQINTSISHLSLYAELFGVTDHEFVNYDGPIPDEISLKKSVRKFLKARGFEPDVFLRQHRGPTHIIEHKILTTQFFTVPRYTREIVTHCREKYDAEFTTSQVSQVLDVLSQKGLIKKLKTDKKNRYQYQLNK